MSPAMTITRRQARRPSLRTLDAAQLQAVTGGFIIINSTPASTSVPSGASLALNFSLTP